MISIDRKLASTITIAFSLIFIMSFGLAPSVLAETQIDNWTDLDNIPDNAENVNYVLTSDLDSGTAGYSGTGDDWTPIGNYADSKTFSATFDGNGHTISDLVVNQPDKIGVGLFGYTEGAVIENVGIKNPDVDGQEDVGPLVGREYGGSVVDNCYVVSDTNSTITGVEDVGGLCGVMSTIKNSYAKDVVVDITTGTNNGKTGAGGVLAGQVENVWNSFAIGDITGSAVGGLVGLVKSGNTNSAAVENAYFLGTVDAKGHLEGTSLEEASYAGGLIGFAEDYGGDNLIINDSYSAASSITSEDYFGGFTCTYSGNVSINDSFWDVESSGVEATGHEAQGLNTSSMKTKSTFEDAGWEIEETTEYDPTNGYPFFSWQVPSSSPTWYIAPYEEETTDDSTDDSTDEEDDSTSYTVVTPEDEEYSEYVESTDGTTEEEGGTTVLLGIIGGFVAMLVLIVFFSRG